jgi:CYTH domain-containing protein
MSTRGTETERTFRVSDLPPDLDRATADRIEQGYIVIGDDGLEVRVRRRGDQSFLTIKQGEGRVRLEEELEIDADRFARLWPLTEGRRLEKTRYVLQGPGGVDIELDVFCGELEGLLTAEVEFPSDAAADDFEPPPWFGEEVTGDSRYRNRSLASQGKP